MAIDNKQQTRRLIEEVWNKGKLDLANELLDPTFSGRDPLAGSLNRDGFVRAVKTYRAAFPDLKLEILSTIAEGNSVCTRWRARGTHQGTLMGIEATGATAEVTGVDVAEFRNGKLIENYSEYDALRMMTQLGVEGTVVSKMEAGYEPELRT